jgi:hypothetical protein
MNTKVSMVDRFLDLLETRVASLEKTFSNVKLPARDETEENMLTREQECQVLLTTIDSILKANQDSSVYLQAKNKLKAQHDGEVLALLISKVYHNSKPRNGKRQPPIVRNPDRIVSCVFSAIRELRDVDPIDCTAFELLAKDIIFEITGSSKPDAPNYDEIGAAARLVKRIIEILPQDSYINQLVCSSLIMYLVEHSGPSLRAAALDLCSASCTDLEFMKRVTRRALEPDAHKSVEEAVRRLAAATVSTDHSSTSISEKEAALGFLLVS